MHLTLAAGLTDFSRMNACGGTSAASLSTAIFFALCASILLPSFIGGLFWQRITTKGAIASMIVGLIVSSFWLVFVHFKEAKAHGICKSMFGVDSLLSGDIIFVDSLIIALPFSTLTVIVVSILTKPMKKEHIDRCFYD